MRIQIEGLIIDRLGTAATLHLYAKQIAPFPTLRYSRLSAEE